MDVLFAMFLKKIPEAHIGSEKHHFTRDTDEYDDYNN
jgi:hypothetical protein